MRPTFKEFLAETQHVEAVLNDLIASEVGRALSAAWDDGDERTAKDILMRELDDTGLANAILAYMFGREDYLSDLEHAWKAG